MIREVRLTTSNGATWTCTRAQSTILATSSPQQDNRTRNNFACPGMPAQPASAIFPATHLHTEEVDRYAAALVKHVVGRHELHQEVLDVGHDARVDKDGLHGVQRLRGAGEAQVAQPVWAHLSTGTVVHCAAVPTLVLQGRVDATVAHATHATRLRRCNSHVPGGKGRARCCARGSVIVWWHSCWWVVGRTGGQRCCANDPGHKNISKLRRA